MMQADDGIPLTEPKARTDNLIRAERGEANEVDFPDTTHAVEHAGGINVQKEIIIM